MTYYSGGKRRIGKEIAAKIAEISQELGGFSGYCEPFCGMMGVYEHMVGYLDKKTKLYAGDRNGHIVKLWKALVKGWKPPIECSKKKFLELKAKGGDSLETIFLGHAAALRACYLTTYRDSGKGKLERQANNCTSAASKYGKVSFSAGDYKQFSHLTDCIIYCDPPYKDTKHHYFVNGVNRTRFDHEEFDEWCRMMSEQNLIIVSEFRKPKDAIEIWSKGKERLFAY